jgi:TonB family protein
MRHLVITLLLLMASNVHAESWVELTKLKPKGTVLFIDMASIERGDPLRKARFKTVYPADRPIGDAYRRVAPDLRLYRWELSLGHFNCAERTIAVSQSTLYGADDKEVGSLQADESALKLSAVAPQSIGGLLLQAVCASSTSDLEPLPGPAKIKFVANPDRYYPPDARRRGEQGSPVVKVCVGPSGALLREPEVTETSGFPELDGAAIKVAAAMRYGAAIENGTALPESCIRFKVKFGPP